MTMVATGIASGVAPLAITACGVVSTAGFGLGPLGAVLADRARPHTDPVTEAVDEYPPQALRTVPPFDVAEQLGRKGIRNLDRLTRLGLVAARQALEAVPAGIAEATRATTGVVIGTTTGSITTATDIGRDTLVNEKPYMVNPGFFPNTVMNTCSGQIAMRNSLLGVNAALSGGQISSLLAVRYARIALARGRATRLLVGAVEEVTARTSWAWYRTGLLSAEAPLGEGAAVFVVEPMAAGGPAPLAELLACEVGYFGAPEQPGLAGGLAACTERALHRSGLSAADVDVVALSAANHRSLARIERRALTDVFGDHLPSVVEVSNALGECYSASGAMQLAGLLALWRDGAGPRSGDRIGVLTSVGEDGNVGALVVRNRLG